ncbi:LOW QUALITY PROTEIN: uncharacterized protein LOC143186400 [Calliopsis andreniformis]|uniref:LOW QUALITY PROTEIN: uncharacterized protein LOC143186400 n=1 Tax=Calliopsis andreniformis TaxID=337506 RepID=UPI003FCCADF2
MIEKNEDNTDNDDSLDRIKQIADKRTFLEKQFLQVQEEIKLSFAHLAKALHAREKLLLRQSEAIYRQQVSLALSSQEVLSPSIIILDERNTLEEQIKQFGKIELIGSNSTVITDLEPYKIQEYQDIDKDHVSFNKSIKSTEIISSNTDIELSSTVEERKTQNASNGLKTFSVTNLAEKCGHILELQEEDTKEDCEQSPEMHTEIETNDFNHQISDINEPEDDKALKNSEKNNIEEQHNSYGHPKQVQQWLDQILLETEIEPTIHEVDKLPEYEISETYICTKL